MKTKKSNPINAQVEKLLTPYELLLKKLNDAGISKSDIMLLTANSDQAAKEAKEELSALKANVAAAKRELDSLKTDQAKRVENVRKATAAESAAKITELEAALKAAKADAKAARTAAGNSSDLSLKEELQCLTPADESAAKTSPEFEQAFKAGYAAAAAADHQQQEIKRLKAAAAKWSAKAKSAKSDALVFPAGSQERINALRSHLFFAAKSDEAKQRAAELNAKFQRKNAGNASGRAAYREDAAAAAEKFAAGKR